MKVWWNIINKFVERFKEKSKYEKITCVVCIISSIIVIVFAVLQILDVWNGAIAVCEIFMGVSMIAQAILQWKRNKGIALFSLGVAAFIFIVAIFVLFVK